MKLRFNKNWQQALKKSLRQDIILGRVLRNSSYLFASSLLGAVLTFVTARLLGVAEFGVLGTVTVFVTGVNRFFSFRMTEVVVKYLGEALAQKDIHRAGAVVKVSMLVEAVTSLVAFGALLALAPIGATYLVKDPQSVSLFWIYSVVILFNLVSETSAGVLQVTNHYRSQALINFLQTALLAILLGLAAVYKAGLPVVLIIYMIGKAILGVGPAVVALYWLPKSLGKSWWRAPLANLPPMREMARFAVNTNFNGTVNLIARDSESLIVPFFFGPTAAGYYKFAQAAINAIVLVINPFITTTYPEFTRTFAQRDWPSLRSLLRRVTVLSASWTVLVGLGLLLLSHPVLFRPWTIFGQTFALFEKYAPAYPVMAVLLVGFGAANIFFWNRPLLLSQGLAQFPVKVGFWAMIAKVGLALLILPGANYVMEAVLLSGYLLVTVGLNVWRGVKEIDRAEAQSDPRLQGEPA